MVWNLTVLRTCFAHAKIKSAELQCGRVDNYRDLKADWVPDIVGR